METINWGTQKLGVKRYTPEEWKEIKVGHIVYVEGFKSLAAAAHNKLSKEVCKITAVPTKGNSYERFNLENIHNGREFQVLLGEMESMLPVITHVDGKQL